MKSGNSVVKSPTISQDAIICGYRIERGTPIKIIGSVPKQPNRTRVLTQVVTERGCRTIVGDVLSSIIVLPPAMVVHDNPRK